MSGSEKMVKITILILSILLIIVVGYRSILKKPIKIENKKIKATIFLTEYEEGYRKRSYIPSGNPSMPFMKFKNKKEDIYNVVLIYNNKRYVINDEKYYYMCKNQNGKEVNCTLITIYYKNRSLSEEIRINYVYN